MGVPFLTASWQDLVVLNFEVSPSLLEKHLPRGTELDLFENKAFISLVAFKFNNNRLFGLIPSFPTHSFEEVNLRFYIKRGDKRAVAFIKEVVPSRVIAGIARLLYQEPYVATNTSSSKINKPDSVELTYSWGANLQYAISIQAEQTQHLPAPNSLEEFILEHYWGYTAQADARTVEYQVRHPKWKFSKVTACKLSEDVSAFYGNVFQEVLARGPSSAFVAEGSKIAVSFPRRFFHPLKEQHPRGWVLYDGACGFCTWWIPFWQRTIKRCGYDIAPLQTDWVREKLQLKDADLANDIRLLLNDGTLINGADAYIYGMKKVWWSFPFGLILGLPLFRQITWAFYKAFNRNRFLVSKVCRLKTKI